MLKFFKMLKDEKGATAIEYGLIAALIAVAAISAMTGLGSQLNTTLAGVSGELAKGTPKTTPTTPAPAPVAPAPGG